MRRGSPVERPTGASFQIEAQPTPRHGQKGAFMTNSPQRRTAQPTLSAPRRAAIAIAACLALSLTLALPSGPAEAGFFDFLFPPLQPAPAAPAYRPRGAPHFSRYRPTYHVERRQRAHFGHPQKKAVAARPQKIVEDKGPVLQRVTGLMQDGSLKRGDAVMTFGGVRVFIGSEGSHHKVDDFAPISESRDLSRRQRSALLAIDPASQAEAAKADNAKPVLLAGRSAADRGLSAGEMIVDPKGNKIRYVGP
jgi:hypothetical protein